MIKETGYTHMFRFAQGTKVSLAEVVDDANLMTVPTPASDLILIHFKLVKWIKSSNGTESRSPARSPPRT